VSQNDPAGQILANEMTTFAAPKIDKSQIYVVDDYETYKAHPVLFYADEWTTTSLNTVVTPDLYYTFLTLCAAGTYLNKKFDHFMFTRGKLRVTVVVQGSSIACGKMVLSFDPCPLAFDQGDYALHVPIAQKPRSMQIPHIEIDPAETKTYVLDLPPPTVLGVFSNANQANSADARYLLGSYRMKQHIINPLGSGTAVVPTINVAVYLSLVSPVVSSMTADAEFNWSSGLKEEHSDGAGGVVSNFFQKASDIAKTISSVPVPVVSEGATLFSKFSGVTAEVLRWFGFSKPLLDKLGYVVVTSHHNATKIDNVLKSDLLSLRSNNAIGISDDICPLLSMKDMVVSELATRKALIKQMAAATTDVVDTLLGVIEVSPMASMTLDDPVAVGTHEIPPCAFVSYPYLKWRGDMKYEIEFVSSVFHRTTILVLYDPVGNVTAPYTSKVSTLQHWTFQVSGHSRETIIIPWKQMELVKNVALPYHPGALTLASQVEFCNGVLYFVLLNPVTTNGSSSPVRINVYSSCENLMLGDLFRGGVPQAPSLDGITENIVWSAAVSTDTVLYAKLFGEEPAHTTKELASRSTFYFQAKPTAATTTDCTIVLHPRPEPSCPVSTTAGTVIALPSLVDYLSAAYVGTRGSYNYLWYPSGGSDVVLGGSVSRTVPSTNDLSVVFSGTFGGQNLMTPETFNWGPYSNTITKINPCLSFTAPYYHQALFKPSYAAVFAREEEGYRLFSEASNNSVLYTSAVMKAAGDDFLFVGFRGLPVSSWSSQT
jgi:hypothetical protein